MFMDNDVNILFMSMVRGSYTETQLSVSNELICIFNKHHNNIPTLFRSPMEQHVFGGGAVEQTWLWKMPPKKAYVLVLGIFHKVHCMTTCTEFEG